MREDLVEVFGDAWDEEQAEALLSTPEYLDYVHGGDIEHFRRAGLRYLRSMADKAAGCWRDGYYEALSLSLCDRADRSPCVRAVRSFMPESSLNDPAEVDAWLDARMDIKADALTAEGRLQEAEISVASWKYERSFAWRSPDAILAELARAGEFLSRLGWAADEARGYVLTGVVPAYARVSSRVTWDTRQFPFPRVSLSIDPSASQDEVLAAFAAQRKLLIERVRPFENRALELHKHTNQVPSTPAEWRGSMEKWNHRFPSATWRFYDLKSYKATVRRIHKSILARIDPDESPINKRKYLGG